MLHVCERFLTLCCKYLCMLSLVYALILTPTRELALQVCMLHVACLWAFFHKWLCWKYLCMLSLVYALILSPTRELALQECLLHACGPFLTAFKDLCVCQSVHSFSPHVWASSAGACECLPYCMMSLNHPLLHIGASAAVACPCFNACTLLCIVCSNMHTFKSCLFYLGAAISFRTRYWPHSCSVCNP
jgi:hypothetical protein